MSTRRNRSMIAAVLAFGLVASSTGAVLAQDAAPTPEDAQKMAVEGLSKLLDALKLFVKSVPQYSAPEVLPNGDIIIRRIHPAPDAAPPKSSAPDETHT